MSKRRRHPVLRGVRIESMAAEGKSLARIDGKVVFVPFSVPGDVVDIQVTTKRSSYMEGYVTHFHQLSPQRVEPFCQHFGVCGGCKWQNLPYELQLEFKQQQVADQLSRIGNVELPLIAPILGSEQTIYYRNKLEFTFCSTRWLTRSEIQRSEVLKQQPVLGFHVPGMFDKVFGVEHCYLQPQPSNAIRNAVRDFAIEHGYPFYNIRSGEGWLRNLIIRTSSTGSTMVILSVFANDPQRTEALLNHLGNKFPQITSLMYVVNPKVNDSINDLDIVCFAGSSYIMEEMEGIRFKVGPKSFYQTNSLQAHELFKVTRDYASLSGSELVYDLYTGTGTIANFIASRCSRVIGVDYVPEAISDARVNSLLNGITNTHFVAGDMKNVITDEFLSQIGHPDVVVLDPPRAGVHSDVLDTIIRASPKRIVYVSCNPATQARDISMLSQNYMVARVQPVDMFPHTHHVESVVLLVSR